MHKADVTKKHETIAPPPPPAAPRGDARGASQDGAPQLGLTTEDEQGAFNALLQDTVGTFEAPDGNALLLARQDAGSGGIEDATSEEREAVAEAEADLARAEEALDRLPVNFGPVRDTFEAEVADRRDALTEAELELDVAEAEFHVVQSNGAHSRQVAYDEARAALEDFRAASTNALADQAEALLDGGIDDGEAGDLLGIFDGLDAEASNALFDELEARGLTQEILRESVLARGDLSVDNSVRAGFYEALAGNLNAENLIRVGDHLEEIGAFRQDVFYTDGPGDFFDLVEVHAEDATKVDIIQQFAADDRFDSSGTGYRDSVTAAELIGSLGDKPDLVLEALEPLTQEQFQHVFNGSVLLPYHEPANDVHTAFAAAIDGLDSADPRGRELIEQFVDNGLGLFEDGTIRYTSLDEGVARDTLSTVFENHFGNLIGNSIDAAGALEPGFAETLESFSEHVLFGTPPGERQGDTAAFLAGQIGEWVNTANGGPHDGTVNFNGVTLSRENLANIAGQTLAHTMNGLDAAIEGAENKQAAREFVVNVAFDLIPGPNVGDVVKAVFDEALDVGKDELLERLAAEDAGIDSHDLDTLYAAIRDGIGGGASTEVDADLAQIRDAFEGGFTGVRPVD